GTTTTHIAWRDDRAVVSCTALRAWLPFPGRVNPFCSPTALPSRGRTLAVKAGDRPSGYDVGGESALAKPSPAASPSAWSRRRGRGITARAPSARRPSAEARGAKPAVLGQCAEHRYLATPPVGHRNFANRMSSGPSSESSPQPTKAVANPRRWGTSPKYSPIQGHFGPGNSGAENFPHSLTSKLPSSPRRKRRWPGLRTAVRYVAVAWPSPGTSRVKSYQVTATRPSASAATLGSMAKAGSCATTSRLLQRRPPSVERRTHTADGECASSLVESAKARTRLRPAGRT